MKTARLLLVATAAAGALALVSVAQERLPEARPSAEEVRSLRLMMEKQGRQLDELRQAVDELSKVVQLKEGVKVAVPPAPAGAPASSGGQPGEVLGALPAPSTTSTPSVGSTPSTPPPEPRVERATPAAPATPAGPQHTVAKGETLTSIAKHYNISIPELHKANKITDDRKLQIGQVLQIPIKNAETPTEKKETP